MKAYKNGKHAYKKDKYIHTIENTYYGKYKTYINTRTGVKVFVKKYR